ncbi:MAG: hypothetical protein J5U17_03980 [Candidatus Methanoperedens sp.]|nr:hypothetical protein [Candidatus Methanoperedens sp.]MCE8424918.1 hypothetical protein [Candidatus Methanoperedens sp.]MCE8428702.1 hypothetical protein [Candidatus Methanoperedens sp.]
MNHKILILFFLLAFIQVTHALEDGVIVPLVADMSMDDGDKGLLLYARVIVTNGTGHVFVDTSPYTQVDLQGSARLAATVASDVMGVDQRSHDFYYIIDITSPIIGGPSAGGALTVATIAAMNNWTLTPGVVMTGMINPDESIGPVGGIPYKLEAAASNNTTLFLVPQGQSTVTVRKSVTITKDPVVIVKDKEETVDVIELGKKLNVTVKEVESIQEAVRIFTGHELIRPVYAGTVLSSRYLGSLEPLAIRMKNESEDNYDRIAIIATDTPVRQQAKDAIDRANKMYDDKKYYAATSLYFNSMILMRIVEWEDGYNKAQDKEKYFIELGEQVEKQIKLSENDLDTFKSYGISDVGAVGAAESRITAARVKLEDAKKMNDSEGRISALAFANERARTAQWWLTLANLDEDVIKVVPEDILKDRAGWYLSQAQSINTYMATLFTESGEHAAIASGASEDISIAQKEMQRGYYSGAIFDSLQVSVKSSTMIGFLGVPEASKKINMSAEAAKTAINEARLAGIEPTLAVSAYEYAEIMSDPFEKINQYTYSKMVAKTLIVLNSHSVVSDKTPIKPKLTPFVSEMPSSAATEIPIEKKTPGFSWIPAIAILFLVRLINKYH